jgi:signal peptidase II
MKKYFIIAFILILVDQLSKFYFSTNFQLGESVEVLHWLNWTFVVNHGAAFSIGSDYTISRYALPLISIIASIFVIIWMFKTSTSNTLRLLALACILGGALGNFIDRALFGYVVDFIDLNIDFWGYRFAIFNIADSCVSIGVVLFLISKDTIANEK